MRDLLPLYTRRQTFMINLSWNVMAFGRKLMKLRLNRIGSIIIELGSMIGRDNNY